MFPYWVLFAYFATGAMLSGNYRGDRAQSSPLFAIGMLGLALMIGLRFEVGADWDTYKLLFQYAGYADLGRVLAIGDPAYQFLSWSARQLGAEIWLVNLICAMFFVWGLWRFAQVQPSPWLALVAAIPYLVIVVAMGYTRQGVAIGILMAGLAAVQRGASTLRFAAYVAAAALFHKTAIVALPMVIFSSNRNRVFNLFAGILALYIFYTSFLADSVDKFVRDYVQTKYSSQGAAIRVAMNIVPASIFLLFRRRFEFEDRERKIWLFHSIAAFGLLVLLLTLPSSTAVDRLALYVMPLQIAILSRVPKLLGPQQGTAAVVVYALAVQFVWLNFATHAKYWVPYSVYPIL